MNKFFRKKVNSVNILISIAIAFLAWFYVAYSVNPMTTKTYRDVPITFEGEYELGERGLGIENASVESLSVKLSLDRSDIIGMSSNRIVATVNVAQLSEGVKKIPVQVTAPDGTVLKYQSHSVINVTVSKSNNRDVDVAVGYKDNNDANIEPYIDEISAARVSVMGAKKLVDEVAYVLLPLNADFVGNNSETFTATPIAVDKTGKEIKHVVVLPSSISVKAHRVPIKTVELDLEVINTGESEMGRTFVAPNSVSIKGSAEILDSIERIEAEPIDISDMKKSGSITIKFKLPEGVQLANSSILAKLKVKVNN